MNKLTPFFYLLLLCCCACKQRYFRAGSSPGDTVMVDHDNWKFYHNIPDIKEGMNVINEKLYFLLGDNRYGAEDSRFIGLVAHSRMYGVIK